MYGGEERRKKSWTEYKMTGTSRGPRNTRGKKITKRSNSVEKGVGEGEPRKRWGQEKKKPAAKKSKNSSLNHGKDAKRGP